MEKEGINTLDMNKLLRKTLIRYISSLLIVGLILFLPAWSFSYWNAWLYISLLFIPILTVMIYLLLNDPELLEKRMKAKEKEKTQKIFVKLSTILFIISFIIPGLDYRFGWSKVPIWLIIVASVTLLLGYLIFIFVIRQNRYASRIIEVQEGQRVIDYGLYSVIRHPMYLSNFIIYLSSPIVLGSFYALIPMVFFCFVMPIRIINEEQVLSKELAGYDDYMKMVRYRIIPYVW